LRILFRRGDDGFQIEVLALFQFHQTVGAVGIGIKYPRAQLLEQILFPSRVVAPEHKTTTVTLRDDTELNGFVLMRTAMELVLRDETLTEHTVKLADVKETRESTLSAMPEGLLAPLTAQEAADLLEYLASNKAAVP
jgi:putative heme-binding domain-containing protein